MSVLEGRVAIITGSSRGIGREFALRLADEGADVVITGKTETDTPQLPGTIYSVADEVRERGRRALSLRVNVREEDDIRSMVERTVEEFGRIDILINNAGALWWERLLETPPKRVDLMWEVNLRASYLGIYHALPHIIRGGGGHVINCSPPILADATQFAMYYAMKMGMTRLAMGVASEHRDDNVSANSLWPATPIESFATKNWPEEKTGRPDQWRRPEILCDALMEILRQPPLDCTGRQLIDEEFLRERGRSDAEIDAYWVGGTPPPDPMYIDRAHGAR